MTALSARGLLQSARRTSDGVEATVCFTQAAGRHCHGYTWRYAVHCTTCLCWVWLIYISLYSDISMIGRLTVRLHMHTSAPHKVFSCSVPLPVVVTTLVPTYEYLMYCTGRMFPRPQTTSLYAATRLVTQSLAGPLTWQMSKPDPLLSCCFAALHSGHGSLQGFCLGSSCSLYSVGTLLPC